MKTKALTVSFNSNGGTGTMDTQTFLYGTEQALIANGFKQIGYLFDGWTTGEDGSGTHYADQAAVTFKPDNDGDTLTLYAKWAPCTEHEWEEGTCKKCGAADPNYQPPGPNDPPLTGDSSSIALYLPLFVISGGALAVAAQKRRTA
ncbi:MAG: InlB B-repeat-containing protein [Clostridia bacterium]|nr:InlB B-repeat-containing protein [Clostridia bacterium]